MMGSYQSSWNNCFKQIEGNSLVHSYSTHPGPILRVVPIGAYAARKTPGSQLLDEWEDGY